MHFTPDFTVRKSVWGNQNTVYHVKYPFLANEATSKVESHDFEATDTWAWPACEHCEWGVEFWELNSFKRILLCVFEI